MATVAEKRAWLIDNGYDVPERGKLRPDLEDAWTAGHGDEWPSDEDLDQVLAGEPEPVVRPEVAPSRKRTRRTTSERRDSLVSRLVFGEGRKKQAPTRSRTRKVVHERVSLEKFTGRMYGLAGKIFQPISPAAARCIDMQGPMAGVLLEDTLKNTMADRILQPLARAEDKLDVAFALMAPPVACAGIEIIDAQLAQGVPEAHLPGLLFRRGVTMQILREGLRTGLEITEKFADEIAARAQRRAESEEKVDELIALIFPPVQAQVIPEPEMAAA